MSDKGTAEMSSSGPEFRGALSGHTFAIVGSLWHKEVVDSMVDGATEAFDGYRLDRPMVLRVAGAMEIPYLVNEVAADGVCSGIIALGVVIRGETSHFTWICDAVTNSLLTISVNRRVPIGYGLLACETLSQAKARSVANEPGHNKGYQAAEAMLSASFMALMATKG